MGRRRGGKSLRIDFTIPEECPAAKALKALEDVEFKSASQIVRTAVMVIYGEAPGLVGKESQRLETLFERLIQALEQRPVGMIAAGALEPEPPKPPEEAKVPSGKSALDRARRK